MNGIPKFMSNSYDASIEESVPVDTSVIHLSASKNNFRRNFDIFYEIDAGNDKNWFSINENTGLIKTHGILDAEMNSEVVLTVLAKEKNSIEWS
jgi:protocadherin gamma subfamily B/protocadherin Fat 4